MRVSYILLFCHPFVPARPVYFTRMSQPGPCISPVCPSQARIFYPYVPVQARAQSRPVCSPIEETQAFVYTHFTNGAWKEWPCCKKREKRRKVFFLGRMETHTPILLERPLVQWLNQTTRKPLLNQIYLELQKN